VASIAIAGVGLIGGSFALALRKAGFEGEIVGHSSPATIAKATALGVIDRGATFDEAARCDLLFLAQPVSSIIESVRRLPGLTGPATIVTDAGSTKRVVVQAAQELANFTGGHPMAGKESRGVEAADADLFRGRHWLLTSEPPPTLRNWIESTGARIFVLSAEEHDLLVALVSHAPQLVSNAIASVTESSRSFGGPGLESMTRLSASSFEIWRDILTTNRQPTVAALDRLILEAQRLRHALDAEDWPTIERSFAPKR
jgi:prephenate dehydrogenase